MGKGIIRQHLSVKFRTETCDVIARTMATLGPKHYRGWKRKLVWLKQTCGHVSLGFLPSNLPNYIGPTAICGKDVQEYL